MTAAAEDRTAPLASMRPRHKTAENPRSIRPTSGASSGFNEAAAQNRGKPWACCARARASSCFNEAAAQNRGKRLPRGVPLLGIHVASMRPRHKTAENGPRVAHRRGVTGRFNEAAAQNRGKPQPSGLVAPDQPDASMRPRHKTAENRCAPGMPRSRPRRFNEAAAQNRGKRDADEDSVIHMGGFNEAAAQNRGKRSMPDASVQVPARLQ